MAGATGFEPAASAVTGQRSNQLSYAPVKGTTKLLQIHSGSQRGIEKNRKKFGPKHAGSLGVKKAVYVAIIQARFSVGGELD
jgi:hypothetical protein